ncbi:MAG: hypothetical protein ACU0CI_03260 [Shimia sp.]
MFKKFAIAAVALALTATAAVAGNNIAIQDALSENQANITFDLVTADAAGLLQVETFNGMVLGTSDIVAGANADVRVKTGSLTSDVFAKLIVDGEVVDEQRIRVE